MLGYNSNAISSHVQLTSRYRVRPTVLYHQGSELSVQVAVEDSVKADISSNTASTTIVVRLLIGVSGG